jgi:hypothetical protein
MLNLLQCMVLWGANMPTEYNPQHPASPMFRDLSDAEAKEFRQWARDNYQPGTPINPVWHPVVQQECNLINTGINPGGCVHTLNRDAVLGGEYCTKCLTHFGPIG